MRFLRFAGLGAAVASALVLSACGLFTKPQAEGVISVVNGEVKKLTPEEEKQFCGQQYCEPNYLYSASMGSALPSQPAQPAPPTTPVPIFPPQPTNTPSPIPAPGYTIPGHADRADYSKALVRAPDAWRITQGSRQIVVAIVDTGVSVNHPDLQDNIWSSSGSFGFDFVHNRANAIDDNRHGTHVAGIIGAELNEAGTVGISPLVKIMPVKFLDAFGSGDTLNAIKAINYAVENGADIISNSWGGGNRSELLNQAIQNAIAKGVIVVAAAGNEKNNNDALPSYPASYPGVIAVASSDETDSLSYFSNFGKSSVLIAAPGSNIYSTVLNGSWAYLSGTSMATPQVSGALALAMAANRNLNATQLTSLLCQSANKILLDKVSCGRLDVYELVRRAAGL